MLNLKNCVFFTNFCIKPESYAMLIELSVGNYRSFKDKVTFSMVAAKLTSKDRLLDETNVFAVNGDLRLLKSTAIYGANASGKSNLAKALEFVRWFIVNSSKETQSTEKIGVERFKLSTETEAKPSLFEIVFLMDGRRYRYGFEVTRDEIVSEWLFHVPAFREAKLFERKSNSFKIAKTFDADGIQQRTRKNALFLSVCAQFNVELADRILDWFTSRIKIVSGLDDRGYLGYTVRCLIEQGNKGEILQLLRKLDLGFGDVKIEEKAMKTGSLPEELPDEIKSFILKSSRGESALVQTMHRKFDENGDSFSTEVFDLADQESEGTRKIFALAGLLVETLKDGKVLIIDEFDARLHPLISQAIVDLFNSNETNPRHAQLIFMTHAINLFSNKLFRRDQIWFAEKDQYGATDLYSLAEFKLRSDASFGGNYMKGKYGAIPSIGDLKHLIDTRV